MPEKMLHKTTVTIWSEFPPAAERVVSDVEDMIGGMCGTSTVHAVQQQVDDPESDPDFSDSDVEIFGL